MSGNANTDWNSGRRPQRYPLPADIAIATLLFIFAVFPGGFTFLSEQIQTYNPSLTTTAWLCATALLCLSQLLRTLNPHLMLALATLGAMLHVIAFDAPSTAVLAVPFCVYSYARYVPGKTARLVLAVGGAGAIFGPIRWFQVLSSGVLAETLPLQPLPTTSAVLSVVLVCVAAVVVPYLIGRMVADRVARDAERQAAAQEHARSVALWNQEQARLAQMRVRADIARELHDIVAHSLSVMIVQADGGRAAARSGNTDAAVTALGTIGDTGRDALTEMRRIVGVLRGEETAGVGGRADFTPNPGLADINTLVTRSGERVTLEVSGTVPGNIPPAVALTAYRIVQEGLTNFLKHAGSQAQAKVSLQYSPGQLSVSVSDNGLGGGNSGEAGYGLRGMSERVGAVGGHFSAGPRETGGFTFLSERIQTYNPSLTTTAWLCATALLCLSQLLRTLNPHLMLALAT
ncbi:MAG: histidine kinase, partial [Propionibacteriaceae bacterium]|nr:histidine kinase [Propionibacteriaceae bacterium]